MAKKPAPTPLTLEQLIAYGGAISANAQALVEDAQVLRDANRLARSYALCTLAIEESHKLPMVWKLMMLLINGGEPDWNVVTRSGSSHTYKLTMAVASTMALPMAINDPAALLEPYALKQILEDSAPAVKEFNARKLAAIYTDLDVNGDAVTPESTVDAILADTILKTARATVNSMAEMHPHVKVLLEQLAAAAQETEPTHAPSA